MKLPPLVAHVAVFIGAALVSAFAAANESQPAPPDVERARELVHIVRQDCGSCHGLTLNGGLGPALTIEAMADKPAESMVATIIGGRPGTPMPPFRGIVTESEAEWIVDQLMRGFPPDTGLPPVQARN
ncbi:MAG TPA: cytochrome c [Thauera sp.]|nr:cytochrome c [Thauera sp.]HNS91824.1 cytochrome c [Thauera sp.]HRJ22340.1 cytochrome c [Thauera sp.]